MSAVMQESLPRHHRMTADEYHRMAEVGLLAPDARVELIEGEILEMAPLGNDHLSVVDQLNHLFVHAVGDRAIVRVQGAVRLSQFSEPQPDLVVLKPRADFYRTQGAGPRRLPHHRGQRHHTALRPPHEGAVLRPPRDPGSLGRRSARRQAARLPRAEGRLLFGCGRHR